MAIFHLNEKNISRSDGRSAVACAAYRACEKLEDYTFGKTQDYTRKKGLEYKSIYAPEHTNEKLLDRQTLWNAVEKKEFNANGSMKENARLAKEYICALPHELTDQERIKIVDDFCRDFVKKHNVIVDACIHAPHDNNDETDNKNYHVHIMFTTRLVNEKGELGKKQRTFNDDGPKILKDSRATFANVVNTALENAGLDERVDHRSYEDQGLKFLEPTQHEGHEVTALRRDGIDTEISLKNDAIKAKNLAAAREYQQVIKGLNQEIIVPNKLEDQIAELENELRLTDAEEHELLAELANLDHEEKLLQEIVNNREYFIELQKVYSDFSNDFYSSQNTVTQKKKELEKQREKSKKWLSKTNFHENQGMLYHNISYEMINDYPIFWLSAVEYNQQIKKIDKADEKQRIAIIVRYDIEATVKELRSVAQTLVEKNQELPVTEKPFLEKLGIKWLSRTYTHSYETLSDFDLYVAPAFKKLEKRDELRVLRDKERERQEIKFEAQNKKIEEESKQIKLENEKRKELERNLRLEAEKQYFNELNFDSQQSKKNNDYTP